MPPAIQRNILENPAWYTACVAYNTKRLSEVAKFTPKVNLLWGVQDPYLTQDAAASIAGLFTHATVKPVQIWHWLMVDAPEQVADLLLAGA